MTPLLLQARRDVVAASVVVVVVVATTTPDDFSDLVLQPPSCCIDVYAYILLLQRRLGAGVEWYLAVSARRKARKVHLWCSFAVVVAFL